MGSSIYFWEYIRNGERSCCLYFSGADICNPNTPCTRNMHMDLMGIHDYIGRLLGLEKSGSFSYAGLLGQAQSYIRYVLQSSILLSYQFDQQRSVKFFHEIEVVKPGEKQPKGASSAHVASSGAPVAKGEDVVNAYLSNLGLVRPLKR